jgi:hypothetical protein
VSRWSLSRNDIDIEFKAKKLKGKEGTAEIEENVHCSTLLAKAILFAFVSASSVPGLILARRSMDWVAPRRRSESQSIL